MGLNWIELSINLAVSINENKNGLRKLWRAVSILAVFYEHICNYLYACGLFNNFLGAQTSPTAPKPLLSELTVVCKSTNIKTDRGSVLMLLHLSAAFNTFYRRRAERDCLTKCYIGLSHICTTGVLLQNSHNNIWSSTGVNLRLTLVCILYILRLGDKTQKLNVYWNNVDDKKL